MNAEAVAILAWLTVCAAAAWMLHHRRDHWSAAACLRARADEADQATRTCAVEDAANVWWHAHGDVLPEAWLLLDVEADR